jgi:hypothetical protein
MLGTSFDGANALRRRAGLVLALLPARCAFVVRVGGGGAAVLFVPRARCAADAASRTSYSR